ncbi:hypothetical protein [Bacillus sp. V2I10]|uniref:hypothetical protein n=1 Tax=Bacillus sp. V2I10 TaxID=3042276 RepID=UPI002786D4C9|nr:hypothetical protein [Bacillus sp. V2I10]MDQ0859850.1 hypothetical protein [Bacillus sp. V2I10]
MRKTELIIKEFHECIENLGSMPFDKALPLMTEEMQRIGVKYNTTGEEVFAKYMYWKSRQKVTS